MHLSQRQNLMWVHVLTLHLSIKIGYLGVFLKGGVYPGQNHKTKKGYKMKKTLFILSLLFIAGCSRIQEGEIYHKQFYPAHTITTMSCTGGKYNVCTPITTRYPNRWKVCIKQIPDGSTKEKKRCIYVPESFYNSHNIGAWIELAR